MKCGCGEGGSDSTTSVLSVSKIWRESHGQNAGEKYERTPQVQAGAMTIRVASTRPVRVGVRLRAQPTATAITGNAISMRCALGSRPSLNIEGSSPAITAADKKSPRRTPAIRPSPAMASSQGGWTLAQRMVNQLSRPVPGGMSARSVALTLVHQAATGLVYAGVRPIAAEGA